jgi:hypothetical protein
MQAAVPGNGGTALIPKEDFDVARAKELLNPRRSRTAASWARSTFAARCEHAPPGRNAAARRASPNDFSGRLLFSIDRSDNVLKVELRLGLLFGRLFA